MLRKFLIALGVLLLSLVVFVAAIFIMLPTDAVRHFAEQTLEQQLKQEQSVEIDELSISPLLNATINGFKMTPRVQSQSQGPSLEGGTYDGFYCAPGVDIQTFVIDRIFVEPSIIPSIKKQPAGRFTLNIQDGIVTGNLSTKSNTYAIDADGSDISLNELAILSNITGMQIYGLLGFNLNAAITKGKLANLSAKLDAQNIALCPKRLKIDLSSLPYIDLPFTVFGNIHADIEILNDKFIIHKLTSDGPDIALDISGDVMLKTSKNPIPRLNIRAKITPSEQWVADNSMGMIYQMCEKLEGGAIELSLSGTTKRLKHDCGTPIIEELPEPETKDADPSEGDKSPKASDEASDKAGDKAGPKAAGVKNGPDAKLGAKALEQPAKPISNKGSQSAKSSKDAPIKAPAMRPSVDGPRRGDPARPPRANRPDISKRNIRAVDRVNRDMDKIDDTIEKDIRRSPRGADRETVPNFGRGVPKS